MKQAEALYHLQEIDLNLIRTRKRLQEIVAVLADNQIVAEAQNQVNAAQRQLTPLQASARNLEFESQTNAEKIRSTEEQLYSGRVKNPKEMQDMQQEIQSLKKRTVELEDRLLETMIAVEAAEVSLDTAKASLKSAEESWGNEHKLLREEQQRLEVQMAALRQQREKALTPISPENLKLYDQLRIKKSNQPIAMFDGSSCTICGVEQNLAVVKDVRQSQGLVYCLSCGRILVTRS